MPRLCVCTYDFIYPAPRVNDTQATTTTYYDKLFTVSRCTAACATFLPRRACDFALSRYRSSVVTPLGHHIDSATSPLTPCLSLSVLHLCCDGEVRVNGGYGVLAMENPPEGVWAVRRRCAVSNCAIECVPAWLVVVDGAVSSLRWLSPEG